MDIESDAAAAHILIYMKHSLEKNIKIKRKTKKKPEETNPDIPKQCQLCHTKKSPLWRKLPGYPCVCNRCGLKNKRK